MNWSQIYKWAGVLQMNVGSLTLFEFMAATRGYGEANGEKQRGGTIGEDRLEEMGIEGF
jgi:hypothetical protein